MTNQDIVNKLVEKIEDNLCHYVDISEFNNIMLKVSLEIQSRYLKPSTFKPSKFLKSTLRSK